MKKAKLIIPMALADDTAQWLGEKNIRVLLSFTKPMEIFEADKIVIIVAVPDETEAEFKTKFATYLK